MGNESNENYSWDPKKRELNIKKRGLDFVELADMIFSDPYVVVKSDYRVDYGEFRYLAFALVDNRQLCLCFTYRGDKKHLITIFKMKEKQWRKHYGDKR